MSAYVFVSVAGGSLGLLAGGLLTAGAQLALGLLRQPPDRRRHVRARPRADPRRPRARARARRRLARLAARHRLADERHLRDRRGDQPRLDVRRTCSGSARSPRVLMAAFLALEARIENPIMPLRILRLRGLVNASLVRGFLVTGMYSTFFLGTLYLEHVRHYSALQTGAAFLPWTLTVAVLSQGITARLVARFGPLPRAHRRAWRAPPPACSCSPPSGRTRRSSRRSSSPASRSASASATRSCRC